MKKSSLIFCIALSAFSLTAFSFIKKSNVDIDLEETLRDKTTVLKGDLVKKFNERDDINLFYGVKSRFNTTITKENITKAKSIVDLLPKNATESIVSYQEVEVSVLHSIKVGSELEATEIGNGDVLNRAQIKLLQSADISTNIRITAKYKSKNAVSGEIEDDYLVYYMTIIPENEAVFVGGCDSLIKYLKENSKATTANIEQDQLKPGMLNFTVTKRGAVKKVKLNSTSGSTSLDKKLIKLITNMPGTWEPATNSKGKKVDQELVLFFGVQGC